MERGATKITDLIWSLRIEWPPEPYNIHVETSKFISGSIPVGFTNDRDSDSVDSPVCCELLDVDVLSSRAIIKISDTPHGKILARNANIPLSHMDVSYENDQITRWSITVNL